jgi:hypothetical protein
MADLFKNQQHYKLNDHNYMQWRNWIRPILQSVDAYDIAIGSEQRPANPNNTAAGRTQQKDFTIRSGKGISVILAACTYEINVGIGHIDDLHNLWESLKRRFDSQTSRDACTIIRNYFDSCSLKKDEKVPQFFARLSDLRQQLINTEFEINDRTFLDHIFKNLRNVSRFRTAIEVLEMNDSDAGLTPETVMHRLEITEQKHNISAGITDMGNESMAEGLSAEAQTYSNRSRGRGRGRGRRGRGRGRGQNRGSGGSKGEKGKEKEDRACYHCGRKGHLMADCHHRKRAMEIHGSHYRDQPKAKRIKTDTSPARTTEGNATIAAMDYNNEDRDAF